MFITMKPISEVYNIDCLEYMKTLSDNCFDLWHSGSTIRDWCGQNDNGEWEEQEMEEKRLGFFYT